MISDNLGLHQQQWWMNATEHTQDRCPTDVLVHKGWVFVFLFLDGVGSVNYSVLGIGIYQVIGV